MPPSVPEIRAHREHEGPRWHPPGRYAAAAAAMIR